MTNKDSPAFPVVSQFEVYSDGISIREYFAGLAMQGMIGKPNSHVDACDEEGNHTDAIDCAYLSVIYADALISELNKEQECDEV